MSHLTTKCHCIVASLQHRIPFTGAHWPILKAEILHCTAPVFHPGNRLLQRQTQSNLPLVCCEPHQHCNSVSSLFFISPK